MEPMCLEDEVRHSLYERSRRSAGWAWIYHCGLVIFSGVITHGTGTPRLRLLYGALTARDVATATFWRHPVKPYHAVGVSLATDVLAGVALRKHIGREQFRERLMGQFGVAAAWALLVDKRGTRIEHVVAIPLGIQLIYCRLWRLSKGDTLVYLIREGSWSLACLYAASRLRKQLEDAAEIEQQEIEVRREFNRRRDERAVHEGVWQDYYHEQSNALTAVAGMIEMGARDVNGDAREGFLRVEQLARAEDERLRRLTAQGPAYLTVASLIARLLVLRPRGDGSVWTTPHPASESPLIAWEPSEASWLMAILQEAEGPVEVTTSESADMVIIEARTGGLPPLPVDEEFPDSWSTNGDIICGLVEVIKT